MNPTTFVVVPWHNPRQLEQFLEAWDVPLQNSDWLVLQHDQHKEGCAVTKNKGVQEALRRGAETVVLLDDDCFPNPESDTPNAPYKSLQEFAARHEAALQPQSIPLLLPVTDPPSRGTPYFERAVTMPVAASLGFWTHVGDYDAPAQLVRGATEPMQFHLKPVFGRYFPLCGMNLAFRPREWLPWCEFIDVPRFDDIWMGWLWQKEAYRRGCCFNLNGPLVRHSRQSHVFANLRAEAPNLERNETLWRDIALSAETDYRALRALAKGAAC